MKKIFKKIHFLEIWYKKKYYYLKKGFLTFDVLLNCNNLKKLNADKDLIISSIKDS